MDDLEAFLATLAANIISGVFVLWLSKKKPRRSKHGKHERRG